MNAALKETEEKLALLLTEIKDAPEFPRARLYVHRLTGGRSLAEYLADPAVPEKARATLAETLTEILLTKDYARLPEMPEPAGAAPTTISASAEVLTGPLPPGVGPDPDEGTLLTRAEVRQMVRAELAEVLETIARCLRQ